MSSFIPAFTVLTVAIQNQNRFHETNMRMIRIRKRKKEGETMNNSILSKYMGKEVTVMSNGYISGVAGTVKEISENWITLEDKKGKQTTFNCDYISSIREK